MVFVYLEGAYTFGSVVSSADFFIFFWCSFFTNKYTISADFAVSNLIEGCSHHSRKMLLWMIFYSISVILWYHSTKRWDDFRSDDIFKTSVASLDILAFLNSFEDCELYFAALRRFFFKQGGGKIVFARDQWLSSNNPSDQWIDDCRVPYKRSSSPRDF